MDNVGIVVESLDAAISFFAELGLELEGRAMIEGDWSGRVTGLRDQRVEIAMMRMPDGHGRIELSRFLTPPAVADHRNAPVNALGYLRVMFAVDDLDDTLARLGKHGAQLVGEVVQYEDVYRLCYLRGPEGILIGLAEHKRASRGRQLAVPVEDRFDVVPVRVDDERRVIPGVVLRAKTRRAVVAAAGFDSGAVELVNGRSVGCGEGHMNGSGRGFPFPDPEISTALDGEPRPLRALHYLHAERLERCS